MASSFALWSCSVSGFLLSGGRRPTNRAIWAELGWFGAYLEGEKKIKEPANIVGLSCFALDEQCSSPFGDLHHVIHLLTHGRE
jgi:hypothetical protein